MPVKKSPASSASKTKSQAKVNKLPPFPAHHEISHRTATIIVILFGLTVFSLAALLSSTQGQELLGINLHGERTSARCIEEPCHDINPPEPVVTITSPIGGQTFNPGQLLHIRWSRMNLPPMARKATLTLVPPRPACLDAHPSCEIAETAPLKITTVLDSGSYDWKIPTNLSNAYIGQMKIHLLLSDGFEATSGQFQIKKTPSRTPPVPN